MATPAKSFGATAGHSDPWKNWSVDNSAPNGPQVIYHVNGENIKAGSQSQADLMRASQAASKRTASRSTPS